MTIPHRGSLVLTAVALNFALALSAGVGAEPDRTTPDQSAARLVPGRPSGETSDPPRSKPVAAPDRPGMVHALGGPSGITQNTDASTIVTLTEVVCADTESGKSTDNFWLRIFDLDGVHGLSGDICVHSVDFGVDESVAAPSAEVDLQLRTWCHDPALPVEYASFELQDTASFGLADTSLSVVNHAVGGCCPAGTRDLVVEVVTEDCLNDGGCDHFYIGANQAGQSATAYIAAPDCGIAEPTPTADVGFPLAHIVMTAYVEEDSDSDGIPDSSDNCPDDPNPSQSDFDSDGEGDACDIDPRVFMSDETISSPTTYDSVVVLTGVTVTIDATLTVNGDLTVDGTLTHTAGSLAGLDLDAAGTVFVSATGAIDVAGKGLADGQTAQVECMATGFGGKTYDPITGSVVCSGAQSAGGSHAGPALRDLYYCSDPDVWGPDSPAPYGSFEAPDKLGAGGGSGRGGGRIHVAATDVVVDGLISADGVGAISGGAGGSVHVVITGSVTGAGSVRANGGFGTISGCGYGGAGSGGRIAITGGASTLSAGQIEARGGGAPQGYGAAGTVFLNDGVGSGELFVENGGNEPAHPTPTRTGNDTSLVSLEALHVDAAALVDSVTGLAATDVEVTSAARLTLLAGSSLGVTNVLLDGGKLDTYVDLDITDADVGVTNDVFSDICIENGGQLHIRAGTTLVPDFESCTTCAAGACRFVDGQVHIDITDANGDGVAEAEAVLDVATDSITVGDGVVLVKDGDLGVPDHITTLTVESGGRVRHKARYLAGLLIDADTVTVEAGGTIDVSRFGLRGANNGSSFGDFSEIFDATCTDPLNASCVIQAPAELRGAAHGGLGGASSESYLYGKLEDADYLGSGGAAGCAFGGKGGGRVQIQADTLNLGGEILADGGDAGTGIGCSGSGGSGGSVRLEVGSLGCDGIDCGQVLARSSGGSIAGGGGRIAVYYDSTTLPDANYSASTPGGGGFSTTQSSAGTIYLKDNAAVNGVLIVDNDGVVANETSLLTDLTTFERIVVRDSGSLRLEDALTVEAPLYLSSGGNLRLADGASITVSNGSGPDVDVVSGTTLSLDGGSALAIDDLRLSGGTVTTSIDLAPATFEMTSGTLNLLGDATFTLASFDTSIVQTGVLYVDESARLAVLTDSVTIGSGVELIKHGKLSGPLDEDEIGAMTIESGGLVRHQDGFLGGLTLNVEGVLQIDTGGMVDTSGRGLHGGGISAPTGNSGETYDVAQICEEPAGATVAGSGQGTGGSYGGYGGERGNTVNLPYGLLENPNHLGSGGGASSNAGGHGGGLVRIVADSISLEGVIKATGDPGGSFAGGGSGGGVRIEVNPLGTGVTGSGNLRARGGAGYSGGAGGRIAVYGPLAPTISVRADGRGTVDVSHSAHAAAGTIYLQPDPAVPGDLILDNYDVITTGAAAPLCTALTEFNTIVVRNDARLLVDTSVLADPNIVAVDLELDDGSLHSQWEDPEGIRFTLSGQFTHANASGIGLRARGLLGGGQSGNPSDAGQSVVAGSTDGSGGSYGGLGGGPTPNAIYDIEQNPRNLGSGGARDPGSNGEGGAGGGRLWIYAPTCLVEAGSVIRVDGEDATSGSGDQGGGSGGALKLDCATISGGGDFEGRGGAGSGTDGNGGGGGRIALRTNDNQLTSDFETVLCDVSGGAATGSGQAGADGSCFLGDLVPPKVVSLSIMPGTTLMDFTDTLVVTFTENLYEGPGGIVPEHVLLTGATTGAHVPSMIAFNNTTQELTVTYPSDLPDDDYTLTLLSGEEDQGFSDLSVNALDGDGDDVAGPDYVAAFTINAPPKVILASPAPNQLDVPEASNVNLTFSELLDAGSVSGTTVRLLDGALEVPATVTLGTSGRVVTLDPAAPLNLNTLYSIEVTTAVKDLTAQAALPYASVFRSTSVAFGQFTLPSVSDEILGLAALSRTGASVASAGDLNGDGLEDWLVGSPSYDTVTDVEAGAVAVYLGSAVLADRNTPDIIFEGVTAHDRTGVDIDGGFDADGDGTPDLLLGAEMVNRTIQSDPSCSGGAAPPAPCDAGKAYLIYFDPADYPNLGNPAVPDVVDLSDVTATIDGVIFNGETLGDQVGFAVRGGSILGEEGNDILGEEGNDIVIGGPGVDNPTGPEIDAGAVYVVTDASNLSGTIDLDRVSSGLGDQVSGYIIRGDAAGDAFGFDIELAPVGLVIPTPPSAQTAPDGHGTARGARGFADVDARTTFAGSTNPAGTTQTQYTVVVGAPTVDYPGLPDAGAMYAVDAGDDLDGDDFIVCVAVAAGDAVEVQGTQAEELLGWSVDVAGDSRVNGVIDLLGGAPGYDVDIQTDAGRVIHTSTTFVGGSMIPTDQIGVTLDGVIWTGANAGDGLGTAVAGVGDVTSDGLDDIILGAPFADPVVDSMTVNEAGIVYLIEGAVPAVGTEGVVSVGEVGVTIPGAALVGTQTGEHAGSSIAGLGDIDGNGDADAAVGAPEFDNGGDLDAGIVYLLLDTEPGLVPGGACDIEGCLVTDPATGALLDVPPGALGGPVSIGLAGIVDEGGPVPPNGAPGGPLPPRRIDGAGYVAVSDDRPVFVSGGPSSLPGPAPAGTVLFGGAELTPAGQAFGNPLPTLYLPVRDEAQSQLDGGETFDLYYWDTVGGSWVDAGIDVTIVRNPVASGKWAASAQIDPLRTYAVFPPDGDGDTIYDGGDNCPLDSNSTQDDGDVDDTGDACDNCVVIFNPSQTDSDLNEVGDACEAEPTLYVSSEPADQPDYGVIQAAVDGVTQDGTTLEVIAGNGYAESVVIDLGLALRIVGDESSGPVVVTGSGLDPAFDVLSTAIVQPVVLENLTIQGEIGVRATADVALRDLIFESIGGTAIVLAAGDQLVEGVAMDSTVADGIDLAAGAELTLRRASMLGLTGSGLSISGRARVESVLLAQGADGIVLAASGRLSLASSTVADGTGAGLDNLAGGTVTVGESILDGNAGGDLLGVPCGDLSSSLVGDVDCTSVNGNLQTDPQFEVDYRLQALSPAIDAGPPPASYPGAPCRDLANGVRLRDGDGDAIATIDLGAYEYVRPATVGAIGDLAWQDKSTLTWTADGGAVEYHVYRDLLSDLSYGNFGVCRDDLDGVRTDTILVDSNDPPSGAGWSYRITGESGGGEEGTLGFAACVERSNFTPCP